MCIRDRDENGLLFDDETAYFEAAAKIQNMFTGNTTIGTIIDVYKRQFLTLLQARRSVLLVLLSRALVQMHRDVRQGCFRRRRVGS